jgi:hypothetical protein
VYNTPEGMLASDVVPEGVYVPEVVVSKNVRKARGRMRVSARLGAGWGWQHAAALWCLLGLQCSILWLLASVGHQGCRVHGGGAKCESIKLDELQQCYSSLRTRARSFHHRSHLATLLKFACCAMLSYR